MDPITAMFLVLGGVAALAIGSFSFTDWLKYRTMRDTALAAIEVKKLGVEQRALPDMDPTGYSVVQITEGGRQFQNFDEFDDARKMKAELLEVNPESDVRVVPLFGGDDDINDPVLKLSAGKNNKFEV